MTLPFRRLAAASTQVVALIALWSCGGEDGMQPRALQSVTVVLSTAGEDPDTDGYTVALGGEQVAVGPSGSVTFDELGPGQYDVSLSGLSPNCDVSAGTMRSATVTESQGANVQFEVACVSVLMDGAFTDAICPNLSLQATSALPLTAISAGTVPDDLEDPLYAYVTWDGGAEAVVSVADRAPDGSVTLLAPYHPSGSMDGGDVSIRIAGGVHACPSVVFSVESLPAASGELEATVDLLQEAVEIQAALVGTSIAELQSLDGTNLPGAQLIPLLVAQSVIDHPDNPNSLRAVVDGSAPYTDGLGLDALERALAGTGFRGTLETAVGQVRPSPTAARVGGPALVDALDCVAADIDSAKELHDCMELSTSAAFSLNGASGTVLSGISSAAGMLGMAPNPAVRVASAVTGAAIFAFQKLREGTANLLPSSFVSLEVEPSKATFLEDEPGPGTWTAEVTASSNGWELDQSVLELLSQIAGGLSTYDAWLNSFMDADDVVDLAGFVVNQVVSNAIAGSGGAGILTVPPETYGPIDVSDQEWSDRNLVPEVALAMTDHAEYEPREPGTSTLSVRTKDGEFGGHQINAQETLTVQALQVSISPDDVTLGPGQQKEFTVTVTSSAHPDSVEIHPETTLSGDVEMAYGGGDTHTVTYTAPQSPLPTSPELLKVRHTAQGGARGFASTEETASATIRYLSVRIAPVLECVAPEDEVQLQATVTGPGNHDVTWSYSAGHVSDSGLFTAPGQPEAVQITVALASNPEITDSITVPVGPCICQFTVSVGSSPTYVGQPGDIAEYFAFETGDPARPFAVAYVTLRAASGSNVTFAVDIAESLVTGPGSYPTPEIGGTLGFGGPYATYDDDGATLQVHEFEPNTTLVGEIVNGALHDANDPNGPTMSIGATFNIYPPPGPFYGTASCQVPPPGS